MFKTKNNIPYYDCCDDVECSYKYKSRIQPGRAEYYCRHKCYEIEQTYEDISIIDKTDNTTFFEYNNKCMYVTAIINCSVVILKCCRNRHLYIYDKVNSKAYYYTGNSRKYVAYREESKIWGQIIPAAVMMFDFKIDYFDNNYLFNNSYHKFWSFTKRDQFDYDTKGPLYQLLIVDLYVLRRLPKPLRFTIIELSMIVNELYPNHFEN